jgi:hypothetical protein
MGNFAAGVNPNYGKFRRINLLGNLRIGNVGAAMLFQVSVLLFLVLGLCFVVLRCNLVLASYVFSLTSE